MGLATSTCCVLQAPGAGLKGVTGRRGRVFTTFTLVIFILLRPKSGAGFCAAAAAAETAAPAAE